MVFVVRGLWREFDPAATPTRNCRAAGLEVKKDRSISSLGRGGTGGSESPSVFVVLMALVAWTVERIDRSWEMTASFRAHSCFSARLSFLVSCSFRRWATIVSVVGASGGGRNVRFYGRNWSVSFE